MTRDPAKVDAELVALVRGRSRAAGDAEVRAALSPLSRAEEKALLKALRTGARGLGPFGWADVARGIKVEVAQAREVSGYYALQAERDVLAALVKGKEVAVAARVTAAAHPKGGGNLDDEAKVDGDERPRPGPKSRAPRDANSRRTEDLLGLFAYHRDAPLVARALRLSLSDLNTELDRLKIRRKAFRLTRGTDHDLASAPVEAGRSGPPRRRRPQAVAEPAVEPPRSEKDEQAHALKALLSEVGPRRSPLAARLGAAGAPLSDAALLARFRAAGLERELSLRERDLIRALWAKHKASEARVAAELQTTPAELRRIAAERGVARELAALRDKLRREARRAKWPDGRIAQVLHQRDELRELGVLEELDREVTARTGVIWTTLKGKRDALELLGKKLRLTDDDTVKLQRLLDLR